MCLFKADGLKGKPTMKKLFIGGLGLLLLCATNIAFADRVFQTSEMYVGPTFGDTTQAEGAAWLRRSPTRVDGRVMVKVDTANTAYSIWWIVFNHPENCDQVAPSNCDVLDVVLNKDSVGAAVFNASGAISAAAGDGGVINVDIELNAREGSNKGYAPFPPIPPESGLPFLDLNGVLKKRNGCGAEIHVDVNEHSEFGDWVTELTQPQGETHRFAVFPAVKCRKNRRDDDSSDD